MTIPANEPIKSRLKRLREERLLTQADLSHKSGVPLPTIKDIERGVTVRPRNTTIRALSQALNVDPHYLLLGT